MYTTKNLGTSHSTSSNSCDFPQKDNPRTLISRHVLLLHPCAAQSPRRGKLFFVSQTGISEAPARRLLDFLTSNDVVFDLVDPSNY
ncbi:hypothetical protein ACFX1X_002336 [Malus domestica]